MAKRHSNELLDGLKSDMRETQLPDECQIGSGREFFWLVIDTKGHKSVSGPYKDSSEASTIAYERLDGRSFQIVGLDTKSKPKAISILKQRRWGETGSLDTALEKMGHKMPGEYKRSVWKDNSRSEEGN